MNHEAAKLQNTESLIYDEVFAIIVHKESISFAPGGKLYHQNVPSLTERGGPMMTYEYAVYFRLLLLNGYPDELQQYIENALVEEDPLSDIVLELAMASDDKELLSVLNEYLLPVNDCDIDYDKSVFGLVISFLKRKYVDDAMPMKSIAELMYQIAIQTDRDSDEPWYTMHILGILFDDAEMGCIDKEEYQHNLEAFINDGVCLDDYPPPKPKESFWKRLIRRIWG